MGDRSEHLRHLQDYARKVGEKEYDDESLLGTSGYGFRLKQTLQSLTETAVSEKAVIKKLQESVGPGILEIPSVDHNQRLQQQRVLKEAYEKLAREEPLLPSSDSPLPALLATRSTQNLIAETRASFTETHAKLSEARQRLKDEDTNLQDSKLITTSVEVRIGKLREQVDNACQRTPDEVAEKAINELRSKKQKYDGQTKVLVRAFNKFTNDHLAKMLAAEELGGPVVGDLLDIDDDMLRAGFSQIGKTKKLKGSVESLEAKRQQRIETIWGLQEEDRDMSASSRNEEDAAATDFRVLVEDLLNSAADISKPNGYVALTRDSAAVRFLVRAKVAQFHPKDARKLRLVDLGQETDA